MNLKILTLFGLLALQFGCEQAPAPPPPQQEAWPHEAETIFQNAEALKYALEQAKLEEQRLRELNVDGQAPILPR